MLEISSPIGNIFLNEEFGDLKNYEKLKISRMELEKRILRRKTDNGTDVGLNLDPGVKLHHGDVIKNGDSIIVIEQQPEKIISIKLGAKNNTSMLVILGHIIGNRHRPISIQNDEILFPIQADSEIEVFTKLFQNIINHIEMSIEERVFSPSTGADIHEH